MIYKLLRRPDGLFVSPVLRLGEVVALGNSYGVHVLADDLESALREGFPLVESAYKEGNEVDSAVTGGSDA